MPFSLEMQHLPSPLHNTALSLPVFRSFQPNTMSREKSRAEIEKFRGRSALFSSSGLLFDTVGFSSEVAANKRANRDQLHRLFPRQTAHNSLHCPTAFTTRVLALVSRNPGIRTTPHGITSSTADLAFRFPFKQTKRKKKVSSVQESKKTAKVALRDAACDSGWLRSTSLTAPFLLFSTFHLSLLAAFALRAAAFFPLALRGAFSTTALTVSRTPGFGGTTLIPAFRFLFSRGKNVQCSHIQCRSSMSL